MVTLEVYLFAEMAHGYLIYFFADDSVLFCRAKVEECQRVLDLLSVYKKGFG